MTATVRGRPFHVGVQLQARRTTWPEYVTAVKVVEELGFGSVWTFDHLLPPAGAIDESCFETVTTLTAMAMITDRARIGVLVNGVLYRDPATLAKSAAQVDLVSGGRLEFSLGTAWAEREFRAYGLEFPSLSERYARLDEALRVVRLLWSEPRASFEGRYYRVYDAPCEPKPVQEPHPPITVGGSGLGALRVTAEHATRWNVQGSVDKCAERAARLQALCDDRSRDFNEIELSLHPYLSLARTHGEAETIAARVAVDNRQDMATQRDWWLLGTPMEVRDQIRRYMEVGISHVVIGVNPPFDMAPLQRFVEEVLPGLE